MATGKEALADYINTQWGGRTRLDWSSFNVPFDAVKSNSDLFTDKTVVLRSTINLVKINAPEIPIEVSVEFEEYVVNFLFLSSLGTGEGTSVGHAEHLKTMINKKTLTHQSKVFHFDAMEIRSGFVEPDEKHWALPCVIACRVFAE